MDTLDLSKKRIHYCREKARKVLKKFERENGKTKLPIPINKVAEYYGFEIYPLDTIPSEQSAIVIIDSNSRRKLIGINASHHENRQRFSVGHELGHFFLQHPAENQCDENEIKLFNQEADEFSAELLIPVRLLKQHLAQCKDVKILAKLFKVSEQTMWIKIKQQGLLNKI